MKRADAEKKMTAIKESIEKMYPGVHAEVRTNEWAKGSYSRLYIDLSCKAAVNGEEKEYVARFGFINMKTNRYNKGTYDMCHFDVNLFPEAKALHDYAQAYRDAKNDGTQYTPNVGYRVIFGLSEKNSKTAFPERKCLIRVLITVLISTTWKRCGLSLIMTTSSRQKVISGFRIECKMPKTSNLVGLRIAY